MGDADYILIIALLFVVVLVLTCAIIYLCRILFRVEEKLSDLELTLHFATDHYLINERKKQESLILVD